MAKFVYKGRKGTWALNRIIYCLCHINSIKLLVEVSMLCKIFASIVVKVLFTNDNTDVHSQV